MDIICYSHLRWNFVYQRPQHLLSRMAKQFRVFYVEEPVFDATESFLDHHRNEDDVWLVVPHLVRGLSEADITLEQNKLLKSFFRYFETKAFIAWYYTPMAIDISIGIAPALIIYDCMDELSAFKFAPPVLKQKEAELFNTADIVFTGGASLYEAKKNGHHNIFLFPSSIDKSHFERARSLTNDLSDQAQIPCPRIGFFGVIDERMDIDLLAAVAEAKPDWHFVLIGPVVKIDEATLPRLQNIHWLGQKSYKELPGYISHWQVAMMPFAINESTRFISPTKTPEYLAAGKPVVSTAIHDVIKSYGDTGLVYIASDPANFIEGIQAALSIQDKSSWLKGVDAVLSENSWDVTVDKMLFHINTALDHGEGKKKSFKKLEKYV